MDDLNKRQILESILEHSEKYNRTALRHLPDEKIDKIYDQLTEAGVVGNVMGIMIWSPMIWVLWRTALGIFSKAQRQCGVYTISNKRDICIQKAKIKFANDKIKILEKLKKDYKSRNKSTDSIDKKINKLKDDINKYKEKVRRLIDQRDVHE